MKLSGGMKVAGIMAFSFCKSIPYPACVFHIWYSANYTYSKLHIPQNTLNVPHAQSHSLYISYEFSSLNCKITTGLPCTFVVCDNYFSVVCMPPK